MMNEYLTGESLVSRRAAALFDLEGLCQSAVVGHCHLHADIRYAGGTHLGGIRSPDQDVIQVGQNHHQVLPGGRHAVRTMPVSLQRKGGWVIICNYIIYISVIVC